MFKQLFDKIFLFFVCCLIFLNESKAQDLSFSQYHYTPFLTNPAMLGTYQDIRLGFHYRYQPMEAGSNYSTPIASFAYPFFDKKSEKPWGVFGLNILSDNIADLIKTAGAMAGFAYNLDLGSSSLSFGMQGGFFQRRIDINNITTDTEFRSGVYVPGDKGENFVNSNITYPIISTGLMWHKKDQLFRFKHFLGLSFNNFNQPDISFAKNGSSTMPYNLTITGGLRAFQTGRFSLMPNFKWIRRLDKNLANIGSWLTYNFLAGKSFVKDGEFSMGLWYNTNKAMVFSFEVNQPKYFLAFSYDVPTGANSSTWLGNGAIELSLGIKIRKKRKQGLIVKDTTDNQLITKADTAKVEKKDSVKKYPVDNIASNNEVIIYPKRDTISIKSEKKDTLVLAVVTSYSKDKMDTLVLDVISKNDFKLTQSDKEVFDNLVIFNFSSPSIDADYGKYLNKVVDILRRNSPVSLHIIGHTCDVGAEFRNVKLAKDRAKAVKEYLITRGVEPNRITTDGVGSKQPLVPNNNEENRRRNRRVEFKIYME